MWMFAFQNVFKKFEAGKITGQKPNIARLLADKWFLITRYYGIVFNWVCE